MAWINGLLFYLRFDYGNALTMKPSIHHIFIYYKSSYP